MNNEKDERFGNKGIKLIKLSYQYQQDPNCKTRLWKQLQPSNPGHKNSDKYTKDKIQDSFCDKERIVPVIKKKPKCPTISNFLKHPQVHSDADNDLNFNLNLSDFSFSNNENKMDTESDIVSILDIHYSDTGASYVRDMGKSLLADRKFHIFLLLSGFKQVYTNMKEQFKSYIQQYRSFLEDTMMRIGKLTSQYEKQIEQKKVQNKKLEDRVCELQLNSKQQKIRLLRDLGFKQIKCKQLENSLNEIKEKYKIERQQRLNYQEKNKNLSIAVEKNEKHIIGLEKKIQDFKTKSQIQKENQLNKIRGKYQKLMNQFVESYQIRLDKCRDKQKKMGSTDTTNSLMSYNFGQEQKEQNLMEHEKIIVHSSKQMHIFNKGKSKSKNKYESQTDKKQCGNSGYEDNKNIKNISLNINFGNSLNMSNIESISSSRRFVRTVKQTSQVKKAQKKVESQEDSKTLQGAKGHQNGNSCPNLNKLFNNYIPNKYYLGADQEQIIQKIKTTVLEPKNEETEQNTSRSSRTKREYKQYSIGTCSSSYLSLAKGPELRAADFKMDENNMNHHKKANSSVSSKYGNCKVVKNTFINNIIPNEQCSRFTNKQKNNIKISHPNNNY